MLQKIRFISSVVLINLATLFLIINAFMPIDRLLPNRIVSNKIQPYEIPTHTVQLPEKVVLSGKPLRVVVPAHEIDLLVEPGIYNPDDGSWSISEANAHYALITPPVNDSGGNTLIYGHNSWPVFYRLTNLKLGDLVHVYTDNSQIFTYTYQKSESVRPDNVELFNYKGSPMLTLQTCAGTWYEQRQLAQFTLLKVEKL